MQQELRDYIYKEKYATSESDSWDLYRERIQNAIKAHENFDKYDRFCNEQVGISLNSLSSLVIENNFFYPAGRILLGVGRNEKRVTLMNCFVLPTPEDSMEGIFKVGSDAAEVYKFGGGVGIDLSSLRPDGEPVSGAGKTSTGAWSWARLFSNITGMVGQAGRRGALLLGMNAKHPDIYKFITMKSSLQDIEKRVLQYSQIPENSSAYELGKKLLKASAIQNANLSVCINDDVMMDDTVSLSWNSKEYKQEKASNILKSIAENSWNSGEPGILFIDTMRRYSNSEGFSPIVITNPCGEQPLPAHGACDLGSINLPQIHSYCIDENLDFYDILDKVTIFGVILLDMVHDWTKFPLEAQANVSRSERRIGVGIMGLADYFLQKRVAYGDSDSIEITKDVLKNILHSSYWCSAWLSEYVGEAPVIQSYGRDKFIEQAGFIQKRIKNAFPDLFSMIQEKGLRNITLTSIAPTGSISLLANVSAGIEPIFFPTQVRNVLGKKFSIDDPYWIQAQGINPKVCVTYKDVQVQGRLLIQAACQEWIDSSVSSTINLPQSATVDDILKLYKDAWLLGLKGITVYREGSSLGSIFDGFVSNNVEADKDFSRPFELSGKTYKFSGYNGTDSLYVTVTGIKNNPIEVFCALKQSLHSEYINALSIQVSQRLKENYGKSSYNKILNSTIEDFVSYRGDSSIYWKGFSIGSPVAFLGYALDFYRKGDYWKKYNERWGEKQSYINLYPGDLNLYDDLPEDAVLTKCPSCKQVIVTKGTAYTFSCDIMCPNCGYAGNKCGH